MTFYATHTGTLFIDPVLIAVFVAIAIVLAAITFDVLPLQLAAWRNPEAVDRYRERQRAAVPESRLERFDWRRYEVGDYYVSWFEDPDDYGDGIAAVMMGIVLLGLAWWMLSMVDRFVETGFGFG